MVGRWYCGGISFLAHSAGVWSGPKVVIESVTVSSLRDDTPIPALVYYPERHNVWAAIFLLHGLNTLGVREPRMATFARQLAASGFLVVAPEVEAIARLTVQPMVVERAEDAFNAVVASPSFAKFETWGFVSASFSAGVGLILLSRPTVKARVRTALLVGPYARFQQTAEYAATSFERDNYAALVLLGNYLGLVLDDTLAIRSALFRGAELNASGCRDFTRWVAQEASGLSTRDREVLSSVFTNQRFREELVATLTRALPSDVARKLSPEHYLSSVACPIGLIHGRDDPVISSAETVWLAGRLRQLGKPCQVSVTRLITHGDRISYLRHLHEVPSLARVVGYFFHHLCAQKI